MGNREAGFLDLSDGVRDSIAIVLATEEWLRSDGQSTVVPERDYALSLHGVVAVEDALGTRLPNAALALTASKLDVVVESWGLKLGAACEHTAFARTCGLPKALVAIGQDGHQFLCVDRQGSSPVRDPWVTVWSQDDQSSYRRKLSEWVEGHVDNVVGDLDFGDAERETISRAGNLARFRPRLTDEPVPATEGQVAMHSKFGRGRVVQFKDGGAKVEVDFGTNGQRVLAARFVTLIDSD